MKYISLFSGMGGFDLAFDRAGCQAVLQVENNKDALRVLQHHWPDIEKIKDIKRAVSVRTSSIVCGGWPCQDLSLAGKRAGLAGERSGLFHEFVRVVDEVRPRWVLGENVPGLFSSAGGRDFATVVSRLVQLGYGVAWCVLDAQHFGVPQRRRRVFIVGCLGDATSAAAVLFEPESCAGNPPPGREKREDVTGAVTRRIDRGGVNSEGGDGHLVAGQCHGSNVGEMGTLRQGNGGLTGGVPFVAQATGNGKFRCGQPSLAASDDNGNNQIVVASTLRSRQSSPGVSAPGRGGEDDQNLVVAHTLRAEGHDASEAGTGRVVPMVFESTVARNGRGAPDDKARALRASEDGGRSDCRPMVFHENQRAEVTISETAGSLKVGGGKPGQGYPALAARSGIRRLTPTECLRLQGFPGDYLDLAPPLSDSAKYRLCGNAIAVPCVQWIANRIVAAERGML